MRSRYNSQMIVNAFTEDKDQNVYIGTAFNGVWFLENETNEIKKLSGLKGNIDIDWVYDKFPLSCIFC